MDEYKRLYIEGEPTRYLIYSDGRIFSEFSNKFLKPFLNKSGYALIDIHHEGVSTYFQVHRLVARLFIPNPDNLETVNHKNGIKTDNRVENLEWMSNIDNVRHAWDTGLAKPRYGEDNPANVYTEKQIHEVCGLLEMGISTNKEISEMTGVSVDTIVDIKYRGKWKKISEQYCFPRSAPDKFRQRKKLIMRAVECGFSNTRIIRILYLSYREEKFLKEYRKIYNYNRSLNDYPGNGSTLTS